MPTGIADESSRGYEVRKRHRQSALEELRRSTPTCDMPVGSAASSSGIQGYNRRVCRVAAMPDHVESPGGLSPPGAPRTVHDRLESHGSRCSAVAMA